MLDDLGFFAVEAPAALTADAFHDDFVAERSLVILRRVDRTSIHQLLLGFTDGVLKRALANAVLV